MGGSGTGFDGCLGETKAGLLSANHFKINVRQQFCVQQSAVLGALGIVDAETFTQGIKTVRAHGMAAPRQGQSIDHPVHRYGQSFDIGQFGIDKIHVEAGIVDDERGISDEGQKVFGLGGEEWLVFEEGRGKAVNGFGLLGHVAFGIQIDMVGLACWQMVQEFDGSDLHNAVALGGIEARGFSIENDFAQDLDPPLFQHSKKRFLHFQKCRSVVYHGVGAAAFLGIWHLAGEDEVQAFFCHTGSGQSAGALKFWR